MAMPFKGDPTQITDFIIQRQGLESEVEVWGLYFLKMM